jgi:hypothetical protein
MKFKCKASGNIIEFTHEVDIIGTLAHPEYEVVLEEPVEVKKEVKSKTKSE